MKNVLILGAGLVSRPIVRYLLERTDRPIVVASRTVSKAKALIGSHPRGRAVAVNVEDDARVEALVKDAEVVVSLVPYTHHVRVAKMAMRHKAHVVTTSYVSPAMKERLVFMDFLTDQTENVFPMVEGGKGLSEMILAEEL